MTRFGTIVLGVLFATVVPRLPQAPATGVVSGTVVSDDAATPLRRVVVTLVGSTLPIGRSAITDDEGRFEIGQVPAGRFMLSATKPAYVTAVYGATRPGQPGTPLTMSDGQRVVDLRIAMARGAVIGGTVRDTEGRPLQNIRVSAIRRVPPGRPEPAPVMAVSDDRGAYRVFGLPRGSYFVAATWASASRELVDLSTQRVDVLLAALERGDRTGVPFAALSSRTETPGVLDAPVFYPGVVDPSLAVPVPVVAGDDVVADIEMRRGRPVRIDGTITGPPELRAGTSVSIRRADEDVLLATSPAPMLYSGPEADGHFVFLNATMGNYVIRARTTSGAGSNGPGSVAWWARASVSVHEDDLSISMTMQPTVRVAGRVRFQGQGASPPQGSSVSIELRQANPGVTYTLFGTALGLSVANRATAGPDGAFALTGVVPDAYDIAVGSIPRGWSLRAITVAGVDVLDSPWMIPAESPGELLIMLSDRPSSLSGSLQTPASRAPSSYSVVIFAADRTLWRSSSRRVLMTRADSAGHYEIPDLPAGDYLIAVPDDLDPDELGDVSFLEKLAPAALKITIAEGEQKVQSLRIGGAAPDADDGAVERLVGLGVDDSAHDDAGASMRRLRGSSAGASEAFDDDRRVDRQQVIGVGAEHRPVALASQQDEMAIDGIRRAGGSEHAPNQTSDGMRHVGHSRAPKQVCDGELTSSAAAPDLGHDPGGGDERRLGIDEALNQTGHGLVSTLEGDEHAAVENHAPHPDLGSAHRGAGRTGARLNRSNSRSPRRSS